MVSRVFGFIRDMITAQFFGAAAAFDAFTVAFRIPNLLRRLSAEGSFSQAFVPVLSEYQKQKSEEEIKQFIGAVCGTLGLVLLVITVCGVVFAPGLVKLFAPGFSSHGDRFDLAVAMLRITFPYLFFISIAAFEGAILNTYNRFWVAAFNPVLLNVCMISAAVFFSPKMHIPIIALAWGVFVAGIIQLFFQWPFLKKIGLLTRPTVNFKDPGVRRVLKLMVPGLFGVSVSQINLMLDSVFASLLVVGSVSWLWFSDRLMEFPLGVIGVAISTVILPHLSRHHASQSDEDFSLTIDWALRCVLLVGLPAAVVFAVISGPLISTLFQHGHFDGHAVEMSRQSLTMFALGIAPFMIIKILAAGFYAKQNMRTPVRVGIIAMISNMVLNVMLIWPFKHAGIALATSLSAMLNAGFLFYYLQAQKIYRPRSGWKFFGFRLLFSNTVLAVWLWYAAGELQEWIANPIIWRAEHLAFLLGSAVVLYFVCLWLCGLRPYHMLIPQKE